MIARIWSQLEPWVLFIGFLAGTWYIHQVGYEDGKADGDVALAELRQQVAEQGTETARRAQADAETAAKSLASEQQRGDRLASDLADAKRELRTKTESLQKEINRVTTLYRRALDAQPEPLPQCVFTRGFVRVWNSTGDGVADLSSTGQGSSRTAAPTAEGDPAEQLDSGVGQADVLDNRVRNGEQCAAIRAQLNRLIDWNLGQ
ncbi:DNA-packaging protein [Pseudomonas knackmussii]|uniref:DNA-packaging protein n=1 Tax=Pseudomonas knackmussii TaxID=65741 RepID=UPI001362E862|nr:DNA-packaging protein [Pseudomonas knackmussii]